MLLIPVHGLRAEEAADPAEATEAAGQSPESTVPEADERAPGDQAVPYEVTIEGDLPDPLREQLESVSQLIALQDRPPDTQAALRRRVRDDVARLESVLRSQSYFGGKVESRLSEDRPVQITIRVTPGAEYLLEAYSIDYRPKDLGPKAPHEAADLELQIGMRARAEPIKRAEDRLIRRLGRHGYPYAEIRQRRYLVDHEREVMEARLTVDSGPRVEVGPLAIEGLTDVSEDYLRRIVEWPEGTVYDSREMERVRRKLIETRLFETVLLEPPEDPPPDGAQAPVRLTLAERQHRSVSLGAGVTSAKDVFLLRAGWEHRNLFHEGERLAFGFATSLLYQELTADFRKPNYLALDQALVATAAFSNERSDAFDALTLEAFAGLDRKFSDTWSGRGGVAFELSDITDQFDSQRFALVGTPLSLTYDTRDDLLNPTRGVQLTAGTTPWLNSDNLQDFFVVNEASGSTYWAPLDDDTLVLAARGRFGSIAFAENREVPATQRFYSGGATLRGYEFRSVGPLDADDDPTGGLSVLEVGLDLRFRVLEDYGIVPFIDGGQVYDQRLPDFGQSLQWAAGIGFRYYTSFGPLRLDLAFPLNPRPDIDSVFQFYLSIGQAF